MAKAEEIKISDTTQENFRQLFDKIVAAFVIPDEKKEKTTTKKSANKVKK